MNKSCHSCNKEISYYAGFCHHCDKKLEYVRAVGREVKIGGGYMDKKTEEKLEDGTIINRQLSRGIFGGTASIEQTIIEPDGTIIEQRWDGWKRKHLLESARIEKSDKKYTYVNGWSWCCLDDDNMYLCDKYFAKFDIDGVNGPNEGKYIDEDRTKYYYKSGPPPQTRLNIIKKDLKCISGALYSRSGELLYSIVDGNGYIFDGDDTLYYCVNGQLNTLIQDIHGSEFERHMKIIQEQENQLATRKKKSAYYGSIEELKEDFNPKKYNKDCPDCFETIKLPAKICHFCKMQFSSDEVESAIDKKFREIYPEP